MEAEIKYTCKGPYLSDKEREKAVLLADANRNGILIRINELRASDDPIPIELALKLAHFNQMLSTPGWDKSLRKGCGEDLTDLIGAIPEDGEPHDVECPKCKNVGSHKRTPRDPD